MQNIYKVYNVVTTVEWFFTIRPKLTHLKLAWEKNGYASDEFDIKEFVITKHKVYNNVFINRLNY